MGFTVLDGFGWYVGLGTYCCGLCLGSGACLLVCFRVVLDFVV